MIVTCGENVVDMIVQEDGSYLPVPGGSPLNIAMALGSLEVPVGYAMPVSSDVLGDQILQALAGRQVRYIPACRPDRPTGLALVSVDAAGQPAYGFYREGAADIDLGPGELPDLDDSIRHLHVGGSPSLGHDHCGDLLVAWSQEQGAGRTMSLDPNVRPALIADRQRFLNRCERLLELCSVCRLSEEDADYMYGEIGEQQVADLLLAKGVELAVVTLGAQGALLATPSLRVKVDVLEAGPIMDAVAAGDCFYAAMLAKLLDFGALAPGAMAGLSEERLVAIGRHACAGAALNCTRKGCSPASRQEIEELLGRAAG